MSDEIKVTEEKKEECKCFCRSEGVKKFVIVALGSFVGVFCALSLFAALHKPPMMRHHHFGPQGGCPVQVIQYRQFKADRHGDFHKNPPREVGRKAPFETQKPQTDD